MCTNAASFACEILWTALLILSVRPKLGTLLAGNHPIQSLASIFRGHCANEHKACWRLCFVLAPESIGSGRRRFAQSLSDARGRAARLLFGLASRADARSGLIDSAVAAPLGTVFKSLSTDRLSQISPFFSRLFTFWLACFLNKIERFSSTYTEVCNLGRQPLSVFGECRISHRSDFTCLRVPA